MFTDVMQGVREENSILTAKSIRKRYARCCRKLATQLAGRLLFDCQAKSRQVICRLSVIIKNE
ncbi:hypothetical protein RSJ21_18045 [Clostridium botulinum]|uniref:Uncharacterized protein n=2 Tax=Clostridium botulinum TaxID=1491 RepID=A5I790_CLOBH|nr:hypothetical protein RSJ15_17460 [Clostridium botulinum]CAL84924.1 hypothetical protein CBO3365 [Clostridium botulinum A str. ATCC 3502]AUN12354.1 hypothetical protein RSJ6_18380 [Clostridium botulinum]AUN23344.1 hypothetical protein RSJ22_18685 [Clostridium botulinum]AUN27045.1 hypothetical protein RSJ21_18045 [Clostridium botulinum]